MPHLELNAAGWKRLTEDCHIHSLDDIVELTGLAPAELTSVFDHNTYPDAEFVAACLGSMPATFNDLFVVTMTIGQLAA